MTTQITPEYPIMNIVNIVNDTTKNYWVNGSCAPPTNSAPNITYTTNGATTTYTATQLWIIGGNGSNLHNVPGVNFDAELVIQHTSSAGGYFYMCYLLASSPMATASDIDGLFTQTNTNITLNTDIVSGTGTDEFIIYTNQVDKISPVAVYTSPIQISSNVSIYQNNLGSIISIPQPVDSQVISNNSASEWMECDNVPIGSDTVATYNLPIQSGLVKDINTLDSFRTIIMFIIFFLACVFSYFLVPSAYLGLINLFIGNGYLDPDTKKSRVATIDWSISAIMIGGLSIPLILSGVFGNPDTMNTGDVLLSGIIIGIIYIIGFIIIQSKKLGGRFIEGVRYTYV
jgi:hypothetical protein